MEHVRKGTRTFNFVLHLKHGHHAVFLQSVWYYDFPVCCLDGGLVIAQLHPLISKYWNDIVYKPLQKILINEVNSRYYEKIVLREDKRRRGALSLLTSNRGDSLNSKLDKLRLAKSQIPRATIQRHWEIVRSWEGFDFELA